jgi:hypothetical protein
VSATNNTAAITNDLQVKVSERQSDSGQWYEGTVSICGLQPTKLARKSDGCTKFTTRSSLTGAARNLAKTLGYNGVAFEEPRRAAAKAALPKPSNKKKNSISVQQ